MPGASSNATSSAVSQQQNPSHILIARSSTGPSPPEMLPTVTPATASGIFPRSSLRIGSSPSATWTINEGSGGTSIEFGPESTEGEDGARPGYPIEVHETFSGSSESRWPGTVKIVVESTTFWAHKEILVFASPFFDSALSGSWSETKARPASMSSIITIQQTPIIPGEHLATTIEEDTIVHPVTPPLSEDSTSAGITASDAPDTSEGEGDFFAIQVPPSLNINGVKHQSSGQSFTIFGHESHSSSSSREGGDEDDGPATASEGEEDPVKTPSARELSDYLDEEEINAARVTSLEKLQGTRSLPTSNSLSAMGRNSASRSPTKKAKRRSRVVEGFITLKEERATIFHDFLHFVYPHLECTITWRNVEGLMNLSDKLCVPSLQNACLDFLLSHAAGKPIKAMRIAEIFGHEELYRESSRFVLENPHGWPDEELNTLSMETRLKLEQRRNWFLERLLKLGTVAVAKEYQCCPTCPEPSVCAKLLEEKWKGGYESLFRFGPAQPSMVFRYLRSLEGASPPLALTHLSCQTHARTWAENLFDRMFSVGIRGSGVDAPARVAGTVATAGPKRHFLYCSLKPETVPSKSAGKGTTSRGKLVKSSGVT